MASPDPDSTTYLVIKRTHSLTHETSENIHRAFHVLAAAFVGLGMAFIFSNKARGGVGSSVICVVL